jgi:hypothetical protein
MCGGGGFVKNGEAARRLGRSFCVVCLAVCHWCLIPERATYNYRSENATILQVWIPFFSVVCKEMYPWNAIKRNVPLPKQGGQGLFYRVACKWWLGGWKHRSQQLASQPGAGTRGSGEVKKVIMIKWMIHSKQSQDSIIGMNTL